MNDLFARKALERGSVQCEQLFQSQKRDINPGFDGVAVGRIAERLLDLPDRLIIPLREIAIDADGGEIDVVAKLNKWSIDERISRG